MICNLLPSEIEKSSENEITVYFCDEVHSEQTIKTTTLCLNAHKQCEDEYE
jgi:hypothetical protein